MVAYQYSSSSNNQGQQRTQMQNHSPNQQQRQQSARSDHSDEVSSAPAAGAAILGGRRKKKDYTGTGGDDSSPPTSSAAGNNQHNSALRLNYQSCRSQQYQYQCKQSQSSSKVTCKGNKYHRSLNSGSSMFNPTLAVATPSTTHHSSPHLLVPSLVGGTTLSGRPGPFAKNALYSPLREGGAGSSMMIPVYYYNRPRREEY